MTTPALANFHSATSSFAGECDDRRLAPAFSGAGKPLVEPARQGRLRLMAQPQQASWIIVVRRRGLPAFDTPCSRSIVPLRHGVGAKPA